MDVSEAYSILEDIVLKGFITTSVSINNKNIILKTVSDAEFKNIEYYLSTGDLNERLLFRVIFSTFMIDGYNFLTDRDEKIKVLQTMYKSIPSIQFSNILKKTDELHERYLSSLRYLEGFSYTDRSRYLWKGMIEGNIATNRMNGIEGSQYLGINSVQSNWVAINRRLDSEDKYEVDFNLSIMVASSFNSKGARSISRTHEIQRTELEETRKKIAEFGYDEIRYKKERALDEWSKPIKSREDIVRELEKQIKGKKDKHDIFIENWIKRQKDIADKAKKSVEKKQEEYRKKVQEEDATKIESSRLASPEEVKKLNQRSPRGLVHRTISMENFNKKQKFIKKVSSVVLKSDK